MGRRQSLELRNGVVDVLLLELGIGSLRLDSLADELEHDVSLEASLRLLSLLEVIQAALHLSGNSLHVLSANAKLDWNVFEWLYFNII